MKRALFVAWVFLGFSAHGLGQLGPNLHLVRLSDKTWGANYNHQIESPQTFLSPRALDRRERQGIAVDSLDLPVSEDVLVAIDGLNDWTVVHASRWMSSVVVEGRDSLADVQALVDLPFVTEVRHIGASRPRKLDSIHEAWAPKNLVPTTSYGHGWQTMEQLNLASLHSLGFQGEDLWIGVMDAGFQLMDTHDAFESLRASGRLITLPGANVAHGGSNVFAHSKHGTSIMGSLGCAWTDSLIGTAPAATYFPFVTEDVEMERLVEEEHWIVAAERADSLGIDLINTSLGYSTFDGGLGNHEVTELDGRTARISVASAIAGSKGMLVVTSAGNSGDDPWRQITFPADAEGILSVGAVRANGTHGWFSGYGPSADGRIKPELMALGVSAPYPSYDGRIRHGNGTSFSAPALCGAAACLWEAHPDATAEEVRTALIQSASHFTTPNDSMGYGIPDLWKAHVLLGGWDGMSEDATLGTNGLRAFPNPLETDGMLRWVLDTEELEPLEANEPLLWELTNVAGERVAQGAVPAWTSGGGHIPLQNLRLASGMHAFSLRNEQGSWVRSATILVVRAE